MYQVELDAYNTGKAISPPAVPGQRIMAADILAETPSTSSSSSPSLPSIPLPKQTPQSWAKKRKSDHATLLAPMTGTIMAPEGKEGKRKKKDKTDHPAYSTPAAAAPQGERKEKRKRKKGDIE